MYVIKTENDLFEFTNSKTFPLQKKSIHFMPWYCLSSWDVIQNDFKDEFSQEFLKDSMCYKITSNECSKAIYCVEMKIAQKTIVLLMANMEEKEFYNYFVDPFQKLTHQMFPIWIPQKNIHAFIQELCSKNVKITSFSLSFPVLNKVKKYWKYHSYEGNQGWNVLKKEQNKQKLLNFRKGTFMHPNGTYFKLDFDQKIWTYCFGNLFSFLRDLQKMLVEVLPIYGHLEEFHIKNVLINDFGFRLPQGNPVSFTPVFNLFEMHNSLLHHLLTLKHITFNQYYEEFNQDNIETLMPPYVLEFTHKYYGGLCKLQVYSNLILIIPVFRSQYIAILDLIELLDQFPHESLEIKKTILSENI